MTKKKIPSNIAQLLWSADLESLDLKLHKKYIIHQVLSQGDLDDWRWLFKQYGKKTLMEAFMNHPKGVYQPRSLYFLSKFVFNLDESLNSNFYV